MATTPLVKLQIAENLRTPPDEASIQVGTQSRAPTAVAASAANKEKTERLLATIARTTSLTDAFASADDVLRQAIQGISDLILVPGLINLDFADVKTIMSGMGVAMMGTAIAQGSRRKQRSHGKRGGEHKGEKGGDRLVHDADDLAAIIEALDLQNATLIGHSTGGGEVARYIGRHGSKRVAKVVLIAAVPPIMLKTPANPEGLPMEVFDGLRAGLVKDRSQFYRDLAIQFYGANRPGAKVSQGTLDQFWLWSMQAGLKNAYESIKAFSETDFTEDLKKIDVPALVLHGEDDQIVPVKDSAKKSAKLIKGAKEIYYPGAPHGITATHQDQVNFDLLEFLRVRIRNY